MLKHDGFINIRFANELGLKSEQPPKNPIINITENSSSLSEFGKAHVS